MSHSPEETVGLDLFDETASAAGSFPHAMRGYERAAVDAYVRDVERMLAATKRKLRQAQRALQARAEETDYGRLGTHTRDLLRTAEAQAAELLKAAESEAQRIRSGAHTDANRLVIDAQQGAAVARESGVGELKRLRVELADQVQAELASAKEQADALRRAAEQHRDMVLAEAERAATATREAATLDARKLRQEAEREAAEVRAALAKEREDALSAGRAHVEEISRTMEKLVATSRQQSEDFGAKLAADAELWNNRRLASLAEAEQLRLEAEAESKAAVEKAKAEAESILANAQAEAKRRNEQLIRDGERLQQRKQAILAQLAGLSSLAGRSIEEFPDLAHHGSDQDDTADDPGVNSPQSADEPAPAGQVPTAADEPAGDGGEADAVDLPEPGSPAGAAQAAAAEVGPTSP